MEARHCKCDTIDHVKASSFQPEGVASAHASGAARVLVMLLYEGSSRELGGPRPPAARSPSSPPSGTAAELSMLKVVDPGAGPLKAAPAACVDQKIAENVPKIGINSQDVAFETELSAHLWNRWSRESGETGLREGMHAAMAPSRLARERSRKSQKGGRRLP